jgi:hypothetical protein
MRGSIPRCISHPLSIIVPPGCFRQVRPRLAVLSLRHLLGPVRHMPMRTASSTLGGRRNAAFSSAIASTVVYFGYPRAYEDEAERSARAGPAQSKPPNLATFPE